VLSLRRGTVTSIGERHEGFVRLEVDGRACIAYPRLTGPVALGDEVIVNVQAVELELGSGGFDILYANLTRGLDLPVEPGAHVMKLPYTPLQFAREHAEESASPPVTLDGMPVVALSLHSQLAPVCAALVGESVAYVQVAGGALPVSFSDAVRILRERELLRLAIGAGPCFDGDVDCVNVYSALLVARERGARVVVCGIGPGVIGTGTRFGHGGMAATQAVHAASALGGRPILALRLSEGDARERHQGLSHHSTAVLALSDETCRTAWPSGCPIDDPLAKKADTVDVGDWREACAGLPLRHMGRGPNEDPWFFAAAFAAGRLAKSLLT
jgi:Protein of unknown function (DUF3866)